MSLWDVIRKILGKPDEARHDYVASTLSFPELNIDRVAQRLRLEEEGVRRGARNEPEKEDSPHDDVEQRIITFIEAEKRRAHETYINHLRTYGDRIASLGFQTRFAQLLAAADRASADFEAKVHVGVDQLFQLRRDVVQMEDDIRQFRLEHGLRRMAQSPPSRTWRWGVILLIVVGEAALNGTFLARGHELGLLGGTFEAFVIAGLNVGAGLLTGWKVAPRLLHRKYRWKVAGALGILLYAIWVFGFNLAVAHYRYTLGLLQPEEAPRLALERLLAQPFDIPDLQAWLLFVLGCGFSLVAAIDGWTMDDPYPGYGALTRRQNELLDAYTDEKQRLMAELEGTRDAALAQMESTAEAIERRRAEYRGILDARQRLERSFWQHLTYLEQCANDLLTVYRESNRGARTSPQPFHFATRWELPRPIDPQLGQEAYLGDQALEAEIGQVFARLPEKRQRVHDNYAAAVRQYQRIDELTPEALLHG
jgi:hypothetical protein